MAELGLSMDDVKNIYSEDSGSISSFDSNVSSSEEADKPAEAEGKIATKPPTPPVQKQPLHAAPAVNIDDDDSDWDSEDENVTDDDKVSDEAVDPVGGKYY